MITKTQLHVGRLSLGLSINALAKLADVAPNSIASIEQGFDFRASTMLALEGAMMERGVLFADGGRIGQRMDWEPNGGRPSDPKIRAGVLRVLNAARKSRGQAPLIDIED